MLEIDKTRLKKTVCNIGYIGEGEYKTRYNNAPVKAYVVWRSMLTRCYNKKYQKLKVTYIGCTVCKEWHNYQTFAKWFQDNYIESYELDKDILFKNNKIYSPITCCFVPYFINTLLTKSNKIRGAYPIGVNIDKRTGKFYSTIIIDKNKKHLGTFNTSLEAFKVYKTVKEKEIKRKAIKYKNYITISCYLALINYNVEITD